MDFRRKCLTLVVVVSVALTVGAVASWAGVRTTRAALPARATSPAQVLSIDNQRRVDVNSLNMFVTNFGSWAYDLSTGNSGLVYPKGTDKTAIFAGGLWFGANVGGQIRTVVGEYSQEYGARRDPARRRVDRPGRTSGTIATTGRSTESTRWRAGRGTRRTRLTSSARCRPVTRPPPIPLVHHSWNEYMTGAVPRGAPWKNYRLPDPASPGDSVDVPGPDVSGDQMLWSVYNDADPERHTNQAGNSAPLGLEIRQTTFSFNRQGALGNTIFLKFEIIHPALSAPTDAVYRTTLQDMYVAAVGRPGPGRLDGRPGGL